MVTLDECGWAAGRTRLAEVPTGLRPYVEQIFVIDFRRAEQPAWKILPDTCGHLLAHLGEDGPRERSRISVVGARTRAITTDVTRRRWCVGVRFRPGGLAALGGDSADRLTDASVHPGSLWGSRGDRMADDLDGADDPLSVRDRLVSWLGELAAPAPTVDWRAEAFARVVRRSRGTKSVGAAAEEIGIAARTLRSAASGELGLPPKHYARIERLFTALAASRRLSWAEVAADSGFSDQAHLVREFRSLLGETPTRFAARGRSMPIRSRPDVPGMRA